MPASDRGWSRTRAGLALLALATLALADSGCASLVGRRWGEQVSVTEIVMLSKHGVAPEKIIGKIQRGGTIYHLSDAQYADLRKQGVTPAVISYMQRVHEQAVKEFPKLAADEDLNCWNLGFDGFWYAGGPFGLHPDC
ncbi:MAG TPA: hypothetical protein VMW19_08800 [Myxococcota bacterium]|nr:hypothetical protein [Myxococcota bacterium]